MVLRLLVFLSCFPLLLSPLLVRDRMTEVLEDDLDMIRIGDWIIK
jgi:hypothetical protein